MPLRTFFAEQTDPKKVTRQTFCFGSRRTQTVDFTLSFAELARRALLRQRTDTTHSPALSGKNAAGQPLHDHQHAHFLPTDEDGDGWLDHLTIHAPGGFDAADLEALDHLQLIYSARGPQVRLQRLDAEAATALPLFAFARVWRSATPFLLPRHLRSHRGKPPRARDLPDAQLGRELANHGFPPPVRVTPTAGAVLASGDVLSWSRFAVERRNGARGHGVAGFEIEFAEPVAGPIALGFASHFGMGLFLPVR